MSTRKQNKNEKPRVKLSETDCEILHTLSRTYWLREADLCVVVGLNRCYMHERLKQLSKAGLIGRVMLHGNNSAANYITPAGAKAIGVNLHSLIVPKLGMAEHTAGVNCVCSWLLAKGQTTMGDLVTERDLRNRKDLESHLPDAYYWSSDGPVAIEFERTRKDARRVEENVEANSQVFHSQLWVWTDARVLHALENIRAKHPEWNIHTQQLEDIEQEVKEYVDGLPQIIPQKSNLPRPSRFGGTPRITAISQLPVIDGRWPETEWEV